MEIFFRFIVALDLIVSTANALSGSGSSGVFAVFGREAGCKFLWVTFSELPDHALLLVVTGGSEGVAARGEVCCSLGDLSSLFKNNGDLNSLFSSAETIGAYAIPTLPETTSEVN